MEPTTGGAVWQLFAESGFRIGASDGVFRMYVELVVSNRRSSVRRLVIRDTALIGRNEKCDIRVISNEISREHCRLEIDESELILVDLGSTNGTFVNGVRVESHQEVSVPPASRIQMGPATFQVNYLDEESEQGAEIPEQSDQPEQENAEQVEEFPISIEEVAEETIPEEMLEETQKATEETAEPDQEDASFPAESLPADGKPVQSEDAAFNEFLKGI